MPANVTFCFTDRDFTTASPPITSFSFSEKEKEGKRKTAQGVPPRSEPRFTPADRDEIKSRGSMRLRPPRPPGERASRESQTTEMLCTAEKVSVFGQNLFARRATRHDFDLAFPSRGSLRKTFSTPYTGNRVFHTLFITGQLPVPPESMRFFPQNFAPVENHVDNC